MAVLSHGVRERSDSFGRERERERERERIENVLEELENQFEKKVLGLKFFF